MYMATDDTVKRGVRGGGKTHVFLRAALRSATDDCILWPYYTMKEGYGQASTHKGSCLAHRLMCEMAHGPAPNATAQATHLCGVKACVNPSHLRWATQVENEHDKHRHGTWFSRISNARLTEDDVRNMRRMYADGKPPHVISKETGVPKSTVLKVVRRYTWKHIE